MNTMIYNNKKIRLRYAPSPTGFLHIGNTRTALFNYLFAKHYKGIFIVRIENTDITRNVKNSIKSQLQDLRWLQIIPDEAVDIPGNYGPYTQLEKLDIYQKFAFKLLKEKKAYYCFCCPKTLFKNNEKKRILVNNNIKIQYNCECKNLNNKEISAKLKLNVSKNIKFCVLQNKIYSFNDLVRGYITFKSNNFKDWIILKSNNIPTYNFAVVIDDIAMKISHVIRGEEHISNTPKQLMIYEAYNKKPPIFGHLTLIVDQKYKKLSKRKHNYLIQFIKQYRKLGYLPQAIFNFMALLGWSPKENKEIFTSQELINIFDENRFSKAPSIFDIKKLMWINSLYIKKLTDIEYLNFIKPFLFSKYNLENKTENWINTLLLIYKKELIYGQEIIKLTKKIIFPTKKISKLKIKILNNYINYNKLIFIFKTKIENIKQWNENEINKILYQIGKILCIKGKELFMPIRIFTSYELNGPELSKIIFLLGKKIILKNINALLKLQK